MLVNPSLEEAQELIIKHLPTPLTFESVPIMQALGRVSAEDVYAACHLPAHYQSAVDGYAVGDPDHKDADRYQISGQVGLGDLPKVPLAPGQAMGVLTGANLPPGTKAVIPHEMVVIKDNYLTSLEGIKPGNNIKQPGEDYVQGDPLVSKGTIIGPGEICLLATYGKEEINLYRKPRVGVLCLSQHVVPWPAPPGPGEIRDSNGPLLSALVLQHGGLPVAIKTAGKEEWGIKKMAADLLAQADLLIITGGTYAEGGNEAHLLMAELGARPIYWDVPVQPGSHTGAAVKDGRLIFALSGNPASCAVGYHLFVVPALLALQGRSPYLPRIKARCISGFPKKSGSRRFIRGLAKWQDAGWEVTVQPGQKPSMLRSLQNCNALIDMPAKHPPLGVGEFVSVLLLKPFN